jgi:hypothetical protein
LVRYSGREEEEERGRRREREERGEGGERLREKREKRGREREEKGESKEMEEKEKGELEEDTKKLGLCIIWYSAGSNQVGAIPIGQYGNICPEINECQINNKSKKLQNTFSVYPSIYYDA